MKGHLAPEVGGVSHRIGGANPRLQIGVEVFVGVDLRDIAGQEAHFDVLGVPGRPLPHFAAVARTQSIRHRKHLGGPPRRSGLGGT